MAVSAPSSLLAVTRDPVSTRALGAALATVLEDGDLIVLAGDLGAGKTCLTQGIGQGLGVDDRITSPTFTIASRYEGRLLLNHLDVYRLDQIEETLDLDLPELLESGVTVIEWGEQIDPALPSDHLVIRLRHTDDDDDLRRTLELEAGGPIWRSRLPAVGKAIVDWTAPC